MFCVSWTLIFLSPFILNCTFIYIYTKFNKFKLMKVRFLMLNIFHLKHQYV